MVRHWLFDNNLIVYLLFYVTALNLYFISKYGMGVKKGSIIIIYSFWCMCVITVLLFFFSCPLYVQRREREGDESSSFLFFF